MDQQNPMGGAQGGTPGGFGPPSGGFGAPLGGHAPPPSGFGAPPSGGFGMPSGGPVQPTPWHKSPRGRMILGGVAFVFLLGMCSVARNKGGSDSKSQTREAADKCRTGLQSEKLVNCMAACSGGEKWACEFADTLKKEREAEKAKEVAEDARRAEERKAREANAVAPSEAVDDDDDGDDDAPSAAPTGASATFPAIVQKFIDMNELKQEEFAKTFKGTVLSGSGKVTEVEKCGFLDDSEKWGDDCVKVVLDSGVPRVALYYGSKDRSKVANYSKGNSVTFSNCVANSIKNWGFWSTATCDMP